MKQQQTKKTSSSNTEYEYVEKNIYKTNGRYRVRVQAWSGYETTLVKARKMRTRFKKAYQSSTIF